MEREARNRKFWHMCQGFIYTNIVLKDTVIIGYFPYHTARIRQRLHRIYTIIPRTFLKGFEDILLQHHIMNNKSVYILEAICTVGSMLKFAIMLKDDYAIIGSWEEVVDYDNKPLRLKSK